MAWIAGTAWSIAKRKPIASPTEVYEDVGYEGAWITPVGQDHRPVEKRLMIRREGRPLLERFCDAMKESKRLLKKGE